MQHAHAYLTRGDHYALLTKAVDSSQRRLKTISRAYEYSYRGELSMHYIARIHVLEIVVFQYLNIRKAAFQYLWKTGEKNDGYTAAGG